jgi:hypothetical protein
MRARHFSIPVLFVASLALGSCSGLPGGGGGGGGGGTAIFSVTLTDTPPAGVSVLNFNVTVTGVALNPSTGTPVSLTTGPETFDLARLQTDAIRLGGFTVPAGTYQSIGVTVSNPVLTIFNQSAVTLSGCAVNKVCKIPLVSAGTITISSAPFPLTLTNGQQKGLRLDFNLANAITSTAGALAVDFTQPNVLTAISLPLPNLPVGQMDSIEDFLGVVSAENQTTKTFTIQSLTRSPLQFVATANAGTVFDISPTTPACPAPVFSCMTVGQVLSVDLAVNADGTLTATEIEFQDSASDDELEGIVTSVDTATQFQIAITDKLQAPTASLIGGLAVGDPAIVTLSVNPAFVVGAKDLPVPVSPLSIFQGSTDTAQMLPGETVEVRVKSFTAGTSGNPPTVSVDRVRLRFTRVTVPVSGSPVGQFFNVTGFPAVFGISPMAQVQTFSPQTSFEGVASASALADTDVVSIRALYIKSAPPFFAAKVRKH